MDSPKSQSNEDAITIEQLRSELNSITAKHKEKLNKIYTLGQDIQAKDKTISQLKVNITDLQTLLTQSNRKNNDLQEKVR